jgi:hypothetical protein
MNSGPFHPDPDLARQRSGSGWNGPEFMGISRGEEELLTAGSCRRSARSGSTAASSATATTTTATD